MIVVISSICLYFSSLSIAHAYIDPASGSALFSALIGIISSMFMFFKGFYYKILSFLFIFFNIKLNQNKYKLVFFSEGNSYWLTFKPVLESLDKKGIKAVYLTSSKNDEGLSFRSKYINSRYIGSGLKAYTYLNKLEASICAMTTPGLDTLQIKRSKYVKHYTYLPHSPIDMGKYKLYSFEGFDSIFLSGAHQERSIRALEKLRATKKKKLYLAGCPYLDELGKKYSQIKNKISFSKRKSKTIMIAPTWGANNLLRFFGVEQIKELIANDFDVIIRPHPQSYITEPLLLQNIKESLNAFKKIQWDDKPDSFDSLSKSDVLISSLSGIIFDYAFIFKKSSIIIDLDYNFIGQEANDLPFPVW